MTGIPTVTVKLDDGTGTYPTDITSRLEGEVSISGYGRSDESPVAESAQLSLTLDNTDGAVSSGAVAIAPGTGIRVTLTSGATTVNRFTGRVATLDLGWPGGGQQFSTVDVTAADRLADLSRKTFRSMIEQEIVIDSATAFYTLAEAAGSTSAGDTSGNGMPSLALAGTGTAMTFGSGIGPTDGLSCASFLGGTFLRSTVQTAFLAASSAWSIECFFATTATPATTAPMVLFDGGTPGEFCMVAITSAGKLNGSFFPVGSVTSAASVNDGLVHHAVLTLTAGGLLTLYLDGVSTGTAAGVALFTAPATRVNVAPSDFVGVFTPYVGTIAHAASYNTALSAGRVTSHAGVLTGFLETTAARFSRIASYVGQSGTTTTGSGQLVSLQDAAGMSAFDALQQVATAEGGVFFADGSGALQLQGRQYRGLQVAPVLALPAEEPSEDTTIPYDTSQLINSVTANRTGGATQVFTDPSATSATGPGPFPDQLDLIVADDPSALYAAQWRVAKHKTAAPRLGSLTLDPFSSVNAAAILALKIGDRISMTLPSQKWASVGDQTIEGWTETVSSEVWSITYNVLPWSLNQAWILDDATFSVLGTTTILGY